jgi:hypothetical protein
VSDADFHAATALALGQVLGEIATLVGLDPDDGELYPIVDRVRRLGAERQQWVREAFRLAERDGWSSFGSHADGRGAELEFDGEDAAGMPLWERPKSGRPARLSGSVVALPEHAYGHIANALADSPHLSEMEVLAALGVITKLIDSWRPAAVEPASATPAEPFGVQLMREGMERSQAEASVADRNAPIPPCGDAGCQCAIVADFSDSTGVTGTGTEASE